MTFIEKGDLPINLLFIDFQKKLQMIRAMLIAQALIFDNLNIRKPYELPKWTNHYFLLNDSV